MAISRNGWDVYTSYSDPHLVNFPWVTGKVRGGDHYAVLEYIARRFNNEVERIDVSASWGFDPRPVRGYTNIWSEHATGTAIDLDANKHPIRTKASKTFSRKQIRRIRKIMKDCRGSARWGGEWTRSDPMHFELIGGNVKVSAMARSINRAPKPKPKPLPKPKGYNALTKRYQNAQRYYPNMVRDGVNGPMNKAHKAWVKRLQNALNQWKAVNPKLKKDGWYGDDTVRATRQVMVENQGGAYQGIIENPVPQPGRILCAMLGIPTHPSA